MFIYKYVNIYIYIYNEKKTTYLKICFELCLYQSILFLQKKLPQNNILQSISDNFRGKLVNED